MAEPCHACASSRALPPSVALLHDRCGRVGAARADARSARRARRRIHSRARGAGLPAARAAGVRWLVELAANEAPPADPPGERRLLGQRDQARAAARHGRLPVFTRKAATDISYVACATTLLKHRRPFIPPLPPQLPHGSDAPRDRPGTASSSSRSSSAWATRSTRRCSPKRRSPYAVRAGRQLHRSASVPGAPDARERRQYLVRAPDRRP